MTTPEDPRSGASHDPLDLTKDAAPSEEPFDPYRFGKPDHPVPPEFAPPGYVPPAPEPPAVPYPYGAPPYGGAPYGGAPYGGTPPPPYGAPLPYGSTPYGSTPYGSAPYGYAPPKQGNGKAVAALVLGIASIVLCWLSILDAVLVVLAIVFGLIGLTESKTRQSGRGKAIAGLVCAAIGAVLAIALTLLVVRATDKCGGTSNSDRPGFNKCVQDNFF